MKFKKILALGVALVFSVAFIAGCGSNNSDNGAKKELTYSKSQGPYSELFEKGVKPILEKQGYTFKGVDMSDSVSYTHLDVYKRQCLDHQPYPSFQPNEYVQS